MTSHPELTLTLACLTVVLVFVAVVGVMALMRGQIGFVLRATAVAAGVCVAAGVAASALGAAAFVG